MTTVIINGKPIDLTDQEGKSDLAGRFQILTEAGPLPIWAEKVDPEFKVKWVTPNHIVMFGPHPGFVMVTVEAEDRDGDRIHGSIFMRGRTSVMLPILICEGIEYTILTVQPRLATGVYHFHELPAGTVGEEGFVGNAAKEIEEETGLVFREDELFDMTAALYGEGRPQEVFFTPGACDEHARFFLARREVGPQFLQDLEGKLTGNLEEGEKITLKVIRFRDLITATNDMKSIVAYALYRELKERDLLSSM